MSDYTPTTDEVDTGFTTFAWDLEREQPGTYGADSGFEDYHKVCAGFRRWLAEVERAAAEKALTDAAEQFATQDGIEALMFAHDDVTAVQATEKWLRARAAALGLTAGQEGETT